MLPLVNCLLYGARYQGIGFRFYGQRQSNWGFIEPYVRRQPSSFLTVRLEMGCYWEATGTGARCASCVALQRKMDAPTPLSAVWPSYGVFLVRTLWTALASLLCCILCSSLVLAPALQALIRRHAHLSSPSAFLSSTVTQYSI